MGKFIGKAIKTIHGTGHGSDYYGACEVCKKHMSEAFVGQNYMVYVRACGQHYLSSGSSVFAHRECLAHEYTADKDDFERIGRSVNVSLHQLEKYGVTI